MKQLVSELDDEKKIRLALQVSENPWIHSKLENVEMLNRVIWPLLTRHDWTVVYGGELLSEYISKWGFFLLLEV